MNDQKDVKNGSAISLSGSLCEQDNLSLPEMSALYENDEKRTQNSVGAIYLICLTIGTGGLQIIWTSVMGQGSPYLSSLGLPPYIISVIWLAGPILGTFMQPYISILSDRSCHPWGRRKPYIGYGTISAIMCLLALPWTGDIVSSIFWYVRGNDESTIALIFRGIIASVLIWGLNVSIQPIQIGLRSLIIDACPPGQQIQAASYTSCITSMGTVFGYTLGYIDLPQLVPWLADTQFKCLSVVASFALSLTVAVTLYTIKERKVILENDLITRETGIISVFREVLRNAMLMSGRIKLVCKAQFFSWLGWFPFLFYISTYLGGLYEKSLREQSIESSSTAYISSLRNNATRQGALAMILFAVVALLSNLILPLLVSSSNRKPSVSLELYKVSNHFRRIQNEENQRLFTKASTKEDSKFTTHPARLLRLRTCVPLSGFTLARVWAASQILASIVLLSTSLSSSRIPSMFLVSLVGVSWASTQWAPLALISVSIGSQKIRRSISARDLLYVQSNNSDLEVAYLEDDCSTSEAENENDCQLLIKAGELQVGAVMGVYNVAIAAPQIIAAVWSSGMFLVLSKCGLEDNEAVGWVIRLGSLSGLVSAWFAFRIDTNDDIELDRSK